MTWTRPRVPHTYRAGEISQYITPDMVGEIVYRKAEAIMMSNANRICGWDWYQAAYPLGVAPTRMEMRNYGRECALAYHHDGHTQDVA